MTVLLCECCSARRHSAAPGEALNVLLRVLGERRWGGEEERLPLITAIATANPIGGIGGLDGDAEFDFASDGGSGGGDDDLLLDGTSSMRFGSYVAELLDAAVLARFTLQARASGHIASGQWEDAARIFDLNNADDGAEDEVEDGKGIGADERESSSPPSFSSSTSDRLSLAPLHAAAAAVRLPPHIRDVSVEVLRVLVEEQRVRSGTNGLLSDRTFLGKAPGELKAAAALEGRDEVTEDDVMALRFLTTFRVPPKVHERMVSGEILRRAIDIAVSRRGSRS